MFVPDTYVGDSFSDQLISKTIWQPAITGQSIAQGRTTGSGGTRASGTVLTSILISRLTKTGGINPSYTILITPQVWDSKFHYLISVAIEY